MLNRRPQEKTAQPRSVRSIVRTTFRSAFTLLPWILGICCVANLAAEDRDRADTESPPLLLAHYMPWYIAKPPSSRWGWHWTMNKFDPDDVSAETGLPTVASHYHPLIGPYDSGDADVLECQLLQMKMAGIDGVIVDWYGLEDFRDYASLHRNTTRLVEQVTRLGMKFVICYEDQTVPALVDAGVVSVNDRVSHVASEIGWLAKHWFTQESYVRFDGKPVLLSFGQSGLTGEEWTTCLKMLHSSVTYVSQHHRRPAATGAFDWPVPNEGVAACERFRAQSAEWPLAIPVVFPRFVDIYEEAGVHQSWGHIADRDGATFRESLNDALNGLPPMIQIATWNDWGEGTVIEPSHEFGYRDLEHLQQTVRKVINEDFAPLASDLRLPAKILELRREKRAPGAQLDATVQMLAQGNLGAARAKLRELERPRQGPPGGQ